MAYTTIDDPTIYFNTAIWTGTGDSTTAVTGVGHQPDFIWIKNRVVADDHMLYDSVRGGTTRIFSNSNAAEGTESQGIQSFDSDGFTTGTHRGTGGDSGNTMVAWNWKETAAAGFDIVSYTGNGSARTISHSLSAVPDMMIVKNRDEAEEWTVYHGANTAAPATDYLALNTTGATTDSNTRWNDTAPTSSVFTVGTSDVVNKNTIKYIAYLFAEKQGYSKFGSYTGNNNADGPFLYTGFKPAFVMTKMTNGAKSWMMYDNKRFPSNPINAYLTLNADTSAAESYGTVYPIDFLSNGFKFNTDTSEVNGTEDHIYMAFAENPFVNSNGVPTNAR